MSHSSSSIFTSWLNHVPSWKQLVHSGHLYSSWERKTLAVALSIFLLTTGWTIINKAGISIASEPVAGGTYTEGLVGQPKYINPVFASASAVDTDLTRLIFSGLMRYDENLNLQFDLAENIEIDESRRQYTVTLKNNLYWHNGEPLTAGDVKFTFDSLGDTALQSPLQSTFQNIVVEIIDDRNLRISLPQPYPPFLHVLTVGIIPQHIWDPIPRNEWRNSDFNLRPIGNGPWQFSTFKQNNQGDIASYTVRSNEASYRAPNISKIVFNFFNSEEAALSALKARAIQAYAFGLGNIPAENDLQNGINYHDLNTFATTAIFFNMEQPGPLENKRVREALRLAINRRDLTIDTLNGQVPPSYYVVPKEFMLNDIELPVIQSDKKAAEDLLDRAGWERIGAIRKNNNDETLNIGLTVVDREPDRRVARYIQEAWQAIGVDVSLNIIRPVTAENIQRLVLEQRQYDALLFTTAYGADLDLYPFWHSSQRVHPGLNLSQIANQTIDDNILKLRSATEKEAKAEALEKAIIDIDSIIPAIFLYSPQVIYAQASKIHGMINTRIAVPADRFNTIETWFADNNYRIEINKEIPLTK